MGAKQEVRREKKEHVVRPFESEPLGHGKVPTEGTGQAFGGVEKRNDEASKEADEEIKESVKRKKRGRT
jgi:hypothetical protein